MLMGMAQKRLPMLRSPRVRNISEWLTSMKAASYAGRISRRRFSFSHHPCLKRRRQSWKMASRPAFLTCSLRACSMKRRKSLVSCKLFISSSIRACIAVGYASKMRELSLLRLLALSILKSREYSAILVPLRMMKTLVMRRKRASHSSFARWLSFRNISISQIVLP